MGNRWWPFTRRTKESTVIAEPPTVESSPLPQWNIYQLASKCPMRVFVSCEVEETSKYLAIDCEPPIEVTDEAMISIKSEYLQLTGGIQVSSMLNKAKAINGLASKIDRVQAMIELAKGLVDVDLCKALAAEGYKINPEADDEAYLKQVEAAHSRLKTERARLDMLLTEKPKAKKGKAAKVTEADFVSNLQTAIGVLSFPYVSIDQLTVLDYASLIKRLRDNINPQLNKDGNGRRAVK